MNYPGFDPACVLDDRTEFSGTSLRVRVMDGGRAAVVTALPDAVSLFPIGRTLCPWVRRQYRVEFVLIEYGLNDERQIDYAMFDPEGALCGYGRCDVLKLVPPGTEGM
jgi:hypothetical protein